MNSKNLDYMFNVEYFEGLDLINDSSESDFIRRNEEISNFKFDAFFDISSERKQIPGYAEFCLKTIYPGLLTGLGYPHDVKAKGAIKNGFFFDCVTGLPCVNGHSLKGALRSVFPDYEQLTANKLDTLEKEKFDVVVELLEAHGLLDNSLSDDEKRDSVINIIDLLFEQTELSYLGAYPVPNGERILGCDYITPHADPTKDPIPIEILKVLPNVNFRFEFMIPDSTPYNKENILGFFKDIIILFGVGAKTNVGYGHFCEIQNVDLNENANNTVANTDQTTGNDEDMVGVCKRCKKNKTPINKSTGLYATYCAECYAIIKDEKKKQSKK